MNRIFAVFAMLAVSITPFSVLAIVPNDEYYDELWYLDRIGAAEAWDTSVGSREIVVAVLDAGFDINHPDVAGNIWINPGEIAGNGMDDDNNGYVDDIHGWDFVDKDNDSNPVYSVDADPEAVSHGSVIAGVIGAVGNNAEGIVGVNWNVSIMSIRMLDHLGSGNSIDAREAIRYAVENGADVINLSFSGTGSDPLLGQEIEAAYESGVVVVAALGNENADTDSLPTYPACYGEGESGDWVIGVASSSRLDEKSAFSNFGSACADITAPGEEIFGVSFYEPNAGYEDPYAGYWSGTSMAAPMVSGAAALLLSVFPTLTPEEVATALKLSVDPMQLPPPYRGKMGAGRLNLANALQTAAAIADSPVEQEEEESPLEQDTTTVFSGTPIVAPVSSTVYYTDEDMKRRAFINAFAYFTYYDSFSEIQPVSDQQISSYALTGLMLPKPGVVLVKIQSDPRVYLLAENSVNPFSPILRAIDTEQIAIQMYGQNWADYVIDIEPTFFSKFTQGQVVTSPIPVDVSMMKTRQQLIQLAQ